MLIGRGGNGEVNRCREVFCGECACKAMILSGWDGLRGFVQECVMLAWVELRAAEQGSGTHTLKVFRIGFVEGVDPGTVQGLLVMELCHYTLADRIAENAWEVGQQGPAWNGAALWVSSLTGCFIWFAY